MACVGWGGGSLHALKIRVHDKTSDTVTLPKLAATLSKIMLEPSLLNEKCIHVRRIFSGQTRSCRKHVTSRTLQNLFHWVLLCVNY